MNDTSLIEYRGITRRFTTRRGTVTACEPVDLTVREGEFLAIVGPSGCGKSTLLNMAAGLLQPSAGRVFYRGEPIMKPNIRVGCTRFDFAPAATPTLGAYTRISAKPRYT